MTSGLRDQQLEHPLESLVAGARKLVEQYADRPAWTLAPAQLEALLPRLAELENSLAAVRLRLLREAERHGIGSAVGHANAAGWWATQARATRPAAHRQFRLAERLDDESHEPTARAMSAGVVSVEQAAVILDAVDALPVEIVGTNLRREAEEHLVSLATEHDPHELRLLGRRILEVIAPDIAEAHEARLLEREEQHAAATASFTMRPDGHGSMYGRFKIPVLAGEILAKHLAAIAAPRHRAATEGDAGGYVERHLRLGQAFVEYLETRDTAGMPKAGGMSATVVVTMTMSDLLGDSDRAATLDTGEWISASEARRLACEAGIIPAILGSPSQVLDLGRKTRFHTEPQRIALAVRDGGCCAEHCDWPPGMCHVHHDKPWAKGGSTSVKDGRLLCPRHHVLAHDARYQMKTATNGKVCFSRRT